MPTKEELINTADCLHCVHTHKWMNQEPCKGCIIHAEHPEFELAPDKKRDNSIEKISKRAGVTYDGSAF